MAAIHIKESNLSTKDRVVYIGRMLFQAAFSRWLEKIM